MATAMARTKVKRFSIALGVGIGAAIVATLLAKSWLYALLAGWDALALTLLALVWHDFHGKSPSQTATMSRQDDMGRSVTDIVLVVASLASLGAVGFLIASPDRSPWHIVLGLASIVLSWATVHVLFMVRYAVMYYDDHEDGIDFSSKAKPTFVDFAYVAFTVGMTYQVSDTTFTSTRFRAVALRHALLSFLFGTAIIATSINFLASLGQ